MVWRQSLGQCHCFGPPPPSGRHVCVCVCVCVWKAKHTVRPPPPRKLVTCRRYEAVLFRSDWHEPIRLCLVAGIFWRRLASRRRQQRQKNKPIPQITLADARNDCDLPYKLCDCVAQCPSSLTNLKFIIACVMPHNLSVPVQYDTPSDIAESLFHFPFLWLPHSHFIL